MDFFNEIRKKRKEKKQKKLIFKIIGGIVSFLLPLLLVMILIFLVLSPLLLFLDKTASIFNPDESQNDKKTFESAILVKEKEYLDEHNLQIDKELILSVLMYGRSYNYDGEYDVDDECFGIASLFKNELNDSCNSESRNDSKKLTKYAKLLADGMVKHYYEYTCAHYENVTKTECDEALNIPNQSPLKYNSYLLRIEQQDGGGSSGGGSSSNCRTVTEKEHDDLQYCDWSPRENDDYLCEGICDPEYDVYKEEKWELKSKEEFITWLKLSEFEEDEYGDKGYNIADKLREVHINMSAEDEEKTVDEAISDIYLFYESVKQSNSSNPNNPAALPDLVYTEGGFSGKIYAWNQCALGGATIPYSGRSYCSGGCGLASTATIIGSLTGSGISPIEIGNTYCTPSTCVSGGTYGFDICSRAARANGLTVSSFGASNGTMMQYAIKKMGEGNSLIQILLKAGSPTGNRVGHFIVITGFNSDGTVSVVDSGYPSNNSKRFQFADLARYSDGMLLVSR